jgi:DNA-directed RNA polymerase specialized sigma subunit
MATAVRRSAPERPASHSRRDAVVQQFLSLADALARRFQRRFTDLIELDDARQVARFKPIRGITDTGGSQTVTQDTKATTCAPTSG